MGYFVMAVVVGAFIGVLVSWAKKENNHLADMLANLTEEQKQKLQDNQVDVYDDKKHTWAQRGMIAQVTEKTAASR